MKIERKQFGRLPGNRSAELYTLTNDNNMSLSVTNYGGIIVSLIVPDRKGNPDDVVLGYDTLDAYVTDSAYLGSLIGRCANRITNAKFKLKGKEIILPANDGANHLHGGPNGFHKQLWKAEEINFPDEVGLKLSYLSKDGEEGYPGTLSVSVNYMLSSENSLLIQYIAETDKTTVVNLTQHSYFNLAGAGKGGILGHSLMINADTFAVSRQGLLPTGEIRSVAGTPMDFRSATPVGARIGAPCDQLTLSGGYDTNWVLKAPGSLRAPAVELSDPESGRVMRLHTTEPGLQFYSGNFLNESIIGKNNVRYAKHAGLCLEPQHFPDSPNQPQFPTTVLSPGHQYSQTTIYQFLVKD